MPVEKPILVRWGKACSDQGTIGASATSLTWPDLAPDRRPGDWPLLLQRLAGLSGEQAVLLASADVCFDRQDEERLVAAARHLGSAGIVGVLDTLDANLSPLPPGVHLPAPLPAKALQRWCGWIGGGLLVPMTRLPLGLALWSPGCAARLLAAAWQPPQPLPPGVRAWVLAERLAIRHGDALAGPDRWPLDTVPPPTGALDLVRRAWPVARPGEPQPDIPGPVAGLDAGGVILHVCHGWGGGSERFIVDLARADTTRSHLLLTSHGDTTRRSYGEWLCLRPAGRPEIELRRYPIAPAIADVEVDDGQYQQVLASILEEWTIDGVIVSSLIGHGLAALKTGRPTLVVVHDYFPLWPQLHSDFGRGASAFGLDALRKRLERTSVDPFAPRSADTWWQVREAYVDALVSARPTMVAPTAQVQRNVAAIAPALAGLNWHVVPHGLAPWPEPVAHVRPPLRDRGNRLRVLVPGRLAGGKGMDLLPALMDRADPRIEFVLLGAGEEAARVLGRPRVHVLSDYDRASLPALVARVAPDLALLPATVSETFSYMLSELQSLAVPVLATALGSYLERIRDGVDGFLAEPEADAIAHKLAALMQSPAALSSVRSFLTGAPVRSASEMADDYRRLLPTAHKLANRRPFRLADAVAGELAAATRLAIETELHRSRLHESLDAAQRELAVRAEWGFGLDRQIGALQRAQRQRDRQLQEQQLAWDQERANLTSRLHDGLEVLAERERWLAILQSEVRQLTEDRCILQARSDELERVHRSWSWRLTAPARILARKVRAAHARLRFQRQRYSSLLGRARRSLSTRGFAGSILHWRNRRRASVPLAPSTEVAVPTSVMLPPRVPSTDQPVVSVIVPAYGKLAYTAACLAALAEHAGDTPLEVIVVDDASPDDSADRLADVEGLVLLRNPENLGFIGSCNAGAAAARGRWLVFLNNDAVVTAGWLQALLLTFDDFPQAGLVGARLLYPDGRLQESGGLVFSDGSGWNYGRFEDPADPRFRYARTTDYCSGAAIAIEKALFDRLGGFDRRYAPAYYEDTDLAFKVRDSGRSVVVQPAATVFHHEGVTSGTDLNAGIKRHQVINQGHFVERWASALARQPVPGSPVDAIVRQAPRGRILVVDATTPETDQDSGSVRLTHLLALLRRSGRHVTFFPDNGAYVAGHSERLQALGIEVLYQPWLGDPSSWLQRHGGDLDAVLVCRHYIASSYLPLVRRFAPRARFLFDTVDLHYLRERRAAALSGQADLARQAEATRAQELRLVRQADVTLVVSPAEQELLAREVPGARVEVLSNIHVVRGSRRGFRDRRDFWFVGGYQHPPNVDAVIWFVGEVMPLVRNRLPDVVFHVVGSKMPAAIRDLAAPGIQVHGHVADLDPFLDGCRLAVAPLRYGAGVKGKVNQSMSHGQPVVATPAAAEGMYLTDGQDVLVASDAGAFADAVVRLYGDEALWQRLSAAGLDNVRRHFSLDAAAAALDRALTP